LLLKLRFGEAGLALLPEIRRITEYSLLRAIHDQIWTVDQPEDLRPIYTITHLTRWPIKLSVSPDETQTACNSTVRFLSFSQKCCTKCNIFVKKHGIFRPAGGASGRLSRQTPGLEPPA